MLKVSIVVPVYNVAQYLECCLESLINQTLKDIEIICVNDASTDNSLEILKSYVSKDNRIKLINFEENKGVSIARNTGIKLAQGEYIGFVDSDDWIDLDFLNQLYMKAISTNADVIKAEMKSGEFLTNLNRLIEMNKYNFTCEFSTALYKTSFIKNNHLLFPEKLTAFEDPVFSLEVLLKQPQIELIYDCYYNRIIHPQSNSKNFDKKAINCYLLGIELIFDMINSSEILSKENYLFLYKNLILRSILGKSEYSKISSAELKALIKEYKNIVRKYNKYPNDIDIDIDDDKLFTQYKDNNTKDFLLRLRMNSIRKTANENRK